MLALLAGLPLAVEVALGVTAICAAIAALHKFLIVPLRNAAVKMGQAADAMLGYDAVLDPATGRVIQPKTMPMAHRVWELEAAQLKTAAALESMAITLEKLLSVSEQVNQLQERHMQHEEFVEQWMHEHVEEGQRWMEEHMELHIIVAETSPGDEPSVAAPDSRAHRHPHEGS